MRPFRFSGSVAFNSDQGKLKTRTGVAGLVASGWVVVVSKREKVVPLTNEVVGAKNREPSGTS